MNGVHAPKIALLAALLAACGSSAQQNATDAEIAAMAPLKHRYSDVAGFDIRPERTLVISLDLQQYIENDDASNAAMRREALARWRAAWMAAHPHEHAMLHLRFIDFIGRPIATESSKV